MREVKASKLVTTSKLWLCGRQIGKGELVCMDAEEGVQNLMKVGLTQEGRGQRRFKSKS